MLDEESVPMQEEDLVDHRLSLGGHDAVPEKPGDRKGNEGANNEGQGGDSPGPPAVRGRHMDDGTPRTRRGKRTPERIREIQERAVHEGRVDCDVLEHKIV